MKIFSLTVVFMHLCTTGSAEMVVRMMNVLLNNGTVPPPTLNCSANDYGVIDQIIQNSIYPTRRLRQTTKVDELQLEEHGDRQLWPIYCRNNCMGYVTSTCRATNCKAYHLESGESNLLSCPDQIKSVNASLNGLMTTNTVTAACRNLLGRPRGFTCYDEIVQGQIENVTVYDTNRRVLNRPNTVLSLCRSVPFKVEVRINSFVEILYGSAVRRGSSTIHTIYAQESTTDTMIFDSRSMALTLTSAGNYTIQFIPDYNLTLSKTLLLNWRSC